MEKSLKETQQELPEVDFAAWKRRMLEEAKGQWRCTILIAINENIRIVYYESLYVFVFSTSQFQTMSYAANKEFFKEGTAKS